MAISFNAHQEEQIRQALAEHVKITDEAEQNAFLDAVEQSGHLYAFGAGSLLNYSHLHKDDGKFKDDLAREFQGIDPAKVIEIEPAKLVGYDKDMVCYDIHYRGTPEAPGITIGLEPTPGVDTPGGILKTRIDHLNPNVVANFICYYLQQFAAREMPPNMPIYTFKQLEVITRDGTKIPALSCVADQNGPLYIHNPNNRYAADPAYVIPRGDFDRRADIIAKSMGSPNRPDGSAKAKGRVTDMDYLRGVIDASIEKDVPVPGHLTRLYLLGLEVRRAMGPAESRHLTVHEFAGIKGHSPQMTTAFTSAVTLHNILTSAANDAAPIRAMA